MSYWHCNEVSRCMLSCDIRRNDAPPSYTECGANDSSDPKQVSEKQPLREKNRKNYHVAHKNKPLHVVAKRNARERKRVQAVSVAFGRLRRAVPIQNVRGKRISKVKTLQHAINYIRTLEHILTTYQDGCFYINNKYFQYSQQHYSNMISGDM